MRAAFQHYLDHRFAWLFASLMLTVGLGPVLEAALHVDVLELLLAVNLAAAIGSAARERWTVLLVALAAAMVVSRAIALEAGIEELVETSHGVWLAATGLAALTSARHAVRPGHVGTERLFAALDTYLLIGLAFGVAYSLLESHSPGSFASAGRADLGLAGGIYFSFVTLATLGYGDIVPVTGVARGVAVLEAITGQLYLAVLVARLVSLYNRPQ